MDILQQLYDTVLERKDEKQEGSYTCYLFEQGLDKILKKCGEECSEVIIAAKNDFAHVKLAEQLQDHTLARTYRCIVTGNLREDTGTVNAPIGRCPSDRKKMAVVPGGRSAVTHWEVIARYPGYTHVRCHLETGRTHQIRVHMAHIGHPILGDTVYGAKKPVPGDRKSVV